MSRDPEQLLWDRMRAGLQRNANLNELFLQRVEVQHEEGLPDLFALREGRVTPIELKVGRIPAHRDTTVLPPRRGLSVEQRNWHVNWANHGGKSMIIIAAQDEHFAVRGCDVDEINDCNYAQLRRLSFLCLEGPAFWNVLRSAL